MNRRVGTWLASAAVAATTVVVHAQVTARPSDPSQVVLETPNLAPAVLRRLEAPYLTAEERSEIRVFHGVWNDSDTASIPAQARIALMAGVYDHASLLDDAAAAEDRAEAALRRGDLEDALEMLAGTSSVRSARIRAEALEGLGRFEAADAAIDPVVSTLMRNRMEAPEDLTEGVRALIIRARLQGKPAGEYQLMMRLLSRVHQEMDRLYWPALLTEAQLLYEKSNFAEAGQAIEQVLTLNPSCADAWALVGTMSARTFDFGRAEAVAASMHRLAARASGNMAYRQPDADLILAMAWMRQNDPDSAEELVHGVLAKHPRMRSARALECAVAALRYDYKRTDLLLAGFDQLSPESPLALYEVGRTLSDARQYAQAAEYLNAASVRQPNWPAPLIELGLLEMQSGRDGHAFDALTKAVRLDEFNVRARNSLRLIEELMTYERVESEHFVVRHPPGVEAVMAREMIEPLERIHADVATMFDHEPGQPTVIELMPDHEWFGVRITGMPSIHTIAACTGPVIAMEAPREGPRHYGVYDWARVIRHEYVHTVTLSRTDNRIPHWFTEAAAVFAEQSPRDYNRWRLLVGALESETLFDMQEINIAFVRPKKPTDRGQAYAQGHWMYEFIVAKWGSRAPLDLMDLYASGVREDDAMCQVLGLSQDEFHAEFIRWARRDAEFHGMLPSPSLRELRLRETLSDDISRAGIREQLMDYARRAGGAIAGGDAVGAYEVQTVPVTPDRVDWWMTQHPDHPDLLEIVIGELFEFTKGEVTEEIAPLLERYAKARPVDPMPHMKLARYHLMSEDPSRAIPHLEYLDEREQYSATYAIELARRYAAEGEYEAAAGKARRATQIAPFDADYREFAATVALKRGDYATAERHIEALTKIEPGREIHERRLEAVRQRMAG